MKRAIRSKAKTNPDSLPQVFLRFASCICLPGGLIGSLDCLCPLRLTRVITLVVGLRYFIESGFQLIVESNQVITLVLVLVFLRLRLAELSNW